MPPSNLHPGDRVVELGALAVSAAVVTGAIASVWIAWLIKKSWLVSAGSLVVGGAVGFAAGQLVARILYRTGENTTVVKVGSASLSATIPAGLAGGITAAAAIGFLAILLFTAWSEAASFFGLAVGCGLVFGLLFACLSSLT